MNHAERVKELAGNISSTAFRHGFEYSESNCDESQVKRERVNAGLAIKELHTAIDAMQSALDESERQKDVWIKQCWVRDEEISGLSGLLDDAEAKLAARDAEVERLRKDAKRLQDFLVRQGLLDIAFCTPDTNAKYWAWWLLWPVYSVDKTEAPLGYGNSKAEAIDAALSEEVKGGG